MNNPLQSLLFAGTSRLTEYFPRWGGRLLDIPIRAAVGSSLTRAFFSHSNRVALNRVRSFKRFLVHPDIHIGDAIMAQAAVTALRDLFPKAEIDFVGNRSVMPLIEGNPEIDRYLPLYSGGVFPPESELQAVAEKIRAGGYDLCLNANPFLAGSRLTGSLPVFDFTSHAPAIARNEVAAEEPNHIIFQYRRFVHQLLDQVAEPQRALPAAGVTVGLTDEAIEQAAHFLQGVPAGHALVLFNTDTASPFTRIPFADQADLLARLLRGNTFVLVGAGHTEAGLGQRLAETVPPESRDRVRLVPAALSLGAFSALSDRCDLFVTGDTGPMHIAAARKYSRSGKHPVRNRTAVLCVFGATPPRLSGYDSSQPGYLAANQQAPSWTEVADSPCRNITCVNKLFKTCRTVRCFDRLDFAAVADRALAYLAA